MIGDRYKHHKANVIDLFNGYKEKREIFHKAMSENDCVDLNFLEERINALKNGKFTLAVAGEVSAGKSTFINALLGIELLPVDVLQSSSAIVEIFKSEKPFLKVKYASGKVDEVYDDLSTPDIDEAKEKLHKISKVQDEYREIPTTLLDEYIIQSSNNFELTEELIKTWVDKANLAGKEKLVKQYICDHPKDNIPVEISFGYPLKWNFDELRIVDSPGVNASGKIQDVAYKYFETANAILFVHNIKPVESLSFRKFVSEVISSRSKDSLFLVLTHAGLYSDSDITKQHTEAMRLFKKFIPEERILVVDSLLKLIYNDLQNQITIKQIEDSSEQKADILPKFEKKAKKENKDLKDVLLEYSRFNTMFEAIDDFSMKAPMLQLREIVEKIKQGYENQDSQYKEKIDLLETKKRNPQEFEAEINRIHDALSNYKNLMQKTIEELNSNYKGRHTEWNAKIDKLKVKYPEKITKSDSFEIVRKYVLDADIELNTLLTAFSHSITKYLSDKLKDTGKEFQQEHKITVPKIDLNAIEHKAKKNAYKKENIYETKTEGIFENGNIWKLNWTEESRRRTYIAGQREVYDEVKHLEAYITQCNKDFYSIIDLLPERTKNVLEEYTDSFKCEMNAAIDGRQKALKEEKNRKQENEEILDEIECLKIKKKEIISEQNRAEAVLGDLKT